MTRDVTTEFTTDRIGIAYVLGVSVNHVNKMVRRGLPRRSRGQYEIAECVQWAISDATTRSGIDPDELPDVVAARTRLYEAQTAHKTLETARMAGQVLDAEEVTQAMLRLSQLMIGALEGLPARASQELASIDSVAEVAAKLRMHCNAARTDCAEHVRAFARELRADGEHDRSAPGQNGGGVGGRRASRGATRESASGPVAN